MTQKDCRHQGDPAPACGDRNTGGASQEIEPRRDRLMRRRSAAKARQAKRPARTSSHEPETGGKPEMLKLALSVAGGTVLLGAVVAAPADAADKKVFYLLSHGGATDAFWIDWNAGATKACEQLNVTCKISFS